MNETAKNQLTNTNYYMLNSITTVLNLCVIKLHCSIEILRSRLPLLIGIVSDYHHAALGSNLEHNIYTFQIICFVI